MTTTNKEAEVDNAEAAEVVYESENYKVTLEPPMDKDNPRDLVYRITNKRFGVVEDECNVFPQALIFAKDFESAVSRLEKGEMEDEPEVHLAH